jgi:metallo-beta-lactamase class B
MHRLLLPLFLAFLSFGQNAEWTRPFPAHRIAGNLYYVGTEDLACFLITTPEGHILINTGLEDSTPLIRNSVTKLGFRLEDVKILLNMQAHYDHVAAMAEIQRITGARVFATEADAPIIEDGGLSDPAFGGKQLYKPIKVDRRLKDGELIKLGGTELKVVTTPGHSKGSVSYTMNLKDGSRTILTAIVNMLTVVMPLRGMAKYPNIAEDIRRSLEKQKQLSPELWVAAHASQYDMHRKLKSGSFIDPQGYKRALQRAEKNFLAKLSE